MERMSIDQIKSAADPVATCKEQIRRWKISYSRYCGSRGEQLREAGITWEMLDEQEGLLKEPDYPT